MPLLEKITSAGASRPERDSTTRASKPSSCEFDWKISKRASRTSSPWGGEPGPNRASARAPHPDDRTAARHGRHSLSSEGFVWRSPNEANRISGSSRKRSSREGSNPSPTRSGRHGAGSAPSRRRQFEDWRRGRDSFGVRQTKRTVFLALRASAYRERVRIPPRPGLGDMEPVALQASDVSSKIGGEGGIRTLGPLARSTVFETAPFDHSGTSPQRLDTTGRTGERGLYTADRRNTDPRSDRAPARRPRA
jgi:hypothetical protein